MSLKLSLAALQNRIETRKSLHGLRNMSGIFSEQTSLLSKISSGPELKSDLSRTDLETGQQPPGKLQFLDKNITFPNNASGCRRLPGGNSS